MINGISIEVEFSMHTVAGMTECRGSHVVMAQNMRQDWAIKEAVEYVQKILSSKTINYLTVTFSAYNDAHRRHVYTTSRVCRDMFGGDIEVYRWLTDNNRDDYRCMSFGKRDIKKLYLECVSKCEEQEVA